MIFKLSEATAARRRAPIGVLVDATDGFTPETGEAAGQPQISKNGAAFGNTAATLVAVGNGLYYVELSAAELDTPGKIFLRYKSANTREHQVQFDVVAFEAFDAAALAATVWASATRTLTQSGAQVAAVVTGTTVTVHRGDTLSIALTALGNLTGNTKVWFTVKSVPVDDTADTGAMLQVEKSVGLVRIAAAAGTAGDGSLTVNDAALGNITIAVLPAASALLVPGSYQYDVQDLTGGAITTRSSGIFIVSADATRAVS